MALITSGEDDVISLKLTRARVGTWVADVLFDDPSPRAGRVSLVASNGQTYVGTIDRGGEFEDTDRTRVIGGAGGMSKPATPRQYSNPTVRIVLGDLLAAAGETLSSTADQDVLATEIAAWTTSAEPIGTVVTALMTTAGGGATWRMLPDGTVWVGAETWPDSGLDADDYQILSKRFEDGSWMVAVDANAVLALTPGTTFEGQRVSMVIHRIDDEHEPGPRMRVWFSDSDETALEDRLAAAIGKLVRGADAPTVDYRALYRAQVIAQSGDTIHVEPEIANSLPDMGKIPLLLGLPGCSVAGVQGGNVLVGWRGGDRSKAYAICFDSSTKVGMLFLGGPAALPALAGTPHQSAEAALITALLAAFTTLDTAATGPLAGLAPGFAAAVAAVTAYQTAAAAANNFLATKVSVL